MDKKMMLDRFFPNLLFPRVRNTDPITSHMAADQAADLATKHHGIILAALEHPGTIYDIAARTDLDHNAVARRMSELERLDFVYPDGKKKGASGRMCRVWVRK
jgi:DNA-binding MarR family transcriptional regulator